MEGSFWSKPLSVGIKFAFLRFYREMKKRSWYEEGIRKVRTGNDGDVSGLFVGKKIA